MNKRVIFHAILMICVMRTFCNGNVAGEFPTETIIALPGIQHKTLMKINISQFCRRLNADLLIYGSEAISRRAGPSSSCVVSVAKDCKNNYGH